MTINKKFGLIVVFLVVIPHAIVLLADILDKKLKSFYASDYENIALLLVFVPLLASLFILYKNYSTRTRSRTWNWIGGVLVLLTGLYFFFAYSFSNMNPIL